MRHLDLFDVLAISAIAGIIAIMIYGTIVLINKHPYTCPQGQDVLYKYELIGKTSEYVPVGCTQN